MKFGWIADCYYFGAVVEASNAPARIQLHRCDRELDVNRSSFAFFTLDMPFELEAGVSRGYHRQRE